MIYSYIYLCAKQNDSYTLSLRFIGGVLRLQLYVSLAFIYASPRSRLKRPQCMFSTHVIPISWRRARCSTPFIRITLTFYNHTRHYIHGTNQSINDSKSHAYDFFVSHATRSKSWLRRARDESYLLRELSAFLFSAFVTTLSPFFPWDRSANFGERKTSWATHGSIEAADRAVCVLREKAARSKWGPTERTLCAAAAREIHINKRESLTQTWVEMLVLRHKLTPQVSSDSKGQRRISRWNTQHRLLSYLDAADELPFPTCQISREDSLQNFLILDDLDIPPALDLYSQFQSAMRQLSLNRLSRRWRVASKY